MWGNILAVEHVTGFPSFLSIQQAEKKGRRLEFTWLSIPLDSIWTPSSWDSDTYIQLIFSGNVLTEIPRGVPHLLPRAAKSRQGCSWSIMSKQQWRLTRFSSDCSLQSGGNIPSEVDSCFLSYKLRNFQQSRAIEASAFTPIEVPQNQGDVPGWES